MGYKLKPYTLRHSLYLIALQHPMVVGKEKETSPQDLLAFLRICSSERPDLAFRKPTIMDIWRIARMQSDIRYFYRAMKDILIYMNESCSSPLVYTKEEGKEKKKDGIPSPLVMATALMSRLHMTPERAWNTPVGQAVWYLTAFSASEGADIKILSTEDEQRADFEKEFLQKLQAEELAKLKEKMRNKMNKKGGD